MARNFLLCDRDQELLLPPSLREWLPEDHLAWFVLHAVEEMDLSTFYGAYSALGRTISHDAGPPSRETLTDLADRLENAYL